MDYQNIHVTAAINLHENISITFMAHIMQEIGLLI
jgi:hypothetical protein